MLWTLLEVLAKLVLHFLHLCVGTLFLNLFFFFHISGGEFVQKKKQYSVLMSFLN